MTKPSKQHHIDHLSNFIAFQHGDFDKVLDDTSNHIEDYVEIRKPLIVKRPYDTLTVTITGMYSVLRRYRIGRQFFYRVYIDCDNAFGPPAQITPRGGFVNTDVVIINCADISDLPELERLSHSTTMGEPVRSLNTWSDPDLTIVQPTGNSVEMFGQFILSPVHGACLIFTPKKLPQPTYDNKIDDYQVSSYYYNSNPNFWGASILTRDYSGKPVYGYTIAAQATRVIYEEDDER